MKLTLIKLTLDSDYAQDLYIQVLVTKHWTLFQASASWCQRPSWPYLQIEFGMGSLISVIFSAYKLGLSIGLLERTWNL
tara:strand:- start:5097 stop:5333 length:237 start_codon:yes stop_codon:yes gene_type:complete